MPKHEGWSSDPQNLWKRQAGLMDGPPVIPVSGRQREDPCLARLGASVCVQARGPAWTYTVEREEAGTDITLWPPYVHRHMCNLHTHASAPTHSQMYVHTHMHTIHTHTHTQ